MRLLATLWTLALLLVAPGPAQDAVARELSARAWALEPSAHELALQGALRSEDWTLRHAAFDALGRTPAGCRWLAEKADHALQATLRGPGPGARPAAIAALAGVELLLPESAPAFGLEQLPEAERAGAAGVALARLLHRRFDGADELLELTRAGGAGGAAAERALLAFGRGAGLAQARWVCRVSPLNPGKLDPARLGRALTAWRVRPPDPGGLPLLFAAAADGPQRPLIEALAARLGAQADLDRLVAGWSDGPPPGVEDEPRVLRQAREVFLRGLAGQGDPALGERLTAEAAALAADDPRLPFVLECAAECADPAALLRAAADWDHDRAEELWSALGARAAKLDLELLAPWLEPRYPEGLRLDAARAVARSLKGERAERAAALLLPLASDTDPSVHTAAFHWLSAVAGESLAWSELYERWLEHGRATRLELLRELPRDAPAPPFRDQLVSLVESSRAPDAGIVELLRHYPGDDEVLRVLEGALQRSEAERSLRALLVALHALDPDGTPARATRALERGLAREEPEGLRGRGWSLAETALELLAHSEAGRARIDALLERAEALPRRLRVELHLALLEARPVAHRQRHAAGLQTLLERDFPGLDDTLRARLLRALEHAPFDPVPFAARIVEGRTSGTAARGAALRVLIRGSAIEPLERVARGSDPDLAAVAVAGLAGNEDPQVTLLLEELLPARSPQSGTAAREQELRLLAALTGRNLVPDDLARRWLGPVLDAAPQLLAQRQQGLAEGGSTEFRWGGELDLADVLLREGRLPESLAALGLWWELDGRLLEALSGRVDTHEGLEQDLSLAAFVALSGEGPARDLSARRSRSLWRWFESRDPDPAALEEWVWALEELRAIVALEGGSRGPSVSSGELERLRLELRESAAEAQGRTAEAARWAARAKGE